MANLRYELMIQQACGDKWVPFRAEPSSLNKAVALVGLLLSEGFCHAAALAVVGETEEPYLWADMAKDPSRPGRTGARAVRKAKT